MKKFILGYLSANSTKLTVFKNKEEASFKSEEWCEVEANTLREAKAKYERTFQSWKEEEQKSKRKTNYMPGGMGQF